MLNLDTNHMDKNNGIANKLTRNAFSPISLDNPNIGSVLDYREMLAYPQNSGVAIVSPINSYSLNLGGAVSVNPIQNNNGMIVGFADNVISATGLINPGSATGYIQIAPASQISGPAIAYPSNAFNPAIHGGPLSACAITNGNFENPVSVIGGQSALIERNETSTSSCNSIFSLFHSFGGIVKNLKVGWKVLDIINTASDAYDNVSKVIHSITNWGNIYFYNELHKYNNIPSINHHIHYLAQHSYLINNLRIV